jgi:DNA invertase Pin-like site-specific DNA recombinase
MNGSTKIQATHRQRQGVVYIRQSDPKQVLKNRESAFNQRALQERLLELGWKKGQIVVIDEDQGRSATHATGREGFQALVADVSLRKIGIILGYEVSRLSRNNADWHRLLELCALFDTLIGDSDGIYHPRDFNDRLLLGLKGTMSEAELHSLRLRLDAGRLSKAKRGQLAQQVPTGLLRTSEGSVAFDPDESVQERLRLVFWKFLELGTVRQVLHYLVQHDLKLPRRQISGVYAGDVLWKAPTRHALESILNNPAYAGVFAYGRRITDPTRQVPGRKATGRIRQPAGQWLALVPDVYPAYITWDQYQRIQAQLQENGQKMQDHLRTKGPCRSGGALLTGLVHCALCGHRMNVSYQQGRWRYACTVAPAHYGKAPCQSLSGSPLDEAVVAEFFKALQPAHIDALEEVSRRQVEHQQELVRHLQKDVARLEYAAKRAERQYNCVEPENRLIAATLEKKWEEALAEWEQAKACWAAAQQARPVPVRLSKEVREAFADVGQRLPELWPSLANEAKKALLRTLVNGVHVLRQPDGTAQIRIVWRGSLVTETSLQLPVRTLRQTPLEQAIIAQVQQLAEEGLGNAAIAACLNEKGLRPCRRKTFTAQIVLKLKARCGIEDKLQQVRRGNLEAGYTVREMARFLKVDPSWIYRAIGVGQIEVARDPEYACYLFPRKPSAIAHMKEFKDGKRRQVSFRKVQSDG